MTSLSEPWSILSHALLCLLLSPVIRGEDTTIASTSVALENGTIPNEIPSSEEDDLGALYAHLTMTRYVVQRVLAPLVVLFGVAGNTINIIVLTQKVMRTSSTNTYLTALAIFDVLYLIFGLTMGLKHYESINNAPLYIRYRKPIGKPIVDTCSNTAIWLTLTFTIERYIGVCHPMKGRSWCTPERARYITIAVCLSAAIITFPEFFEYHVEEAVDPATNLTVLNPAQTKFGSAHSYKWGYSYINQALFTFLPLLLLIIFNSFLIRAVLTASKKRRAMTNDIGVTNDRQDRQNREQQKITIMLIGVVIVFLICQLPQAIMNLYVTYIQVTKSFTDRTIIIVTILSNVFNLLVQINSSMNFILYSSLSLRFRRVFKRIFCRCLIHNQPNRHIFSDAGGEGSRTNLILHAPHSQRGGSPRKPANTNTRATQEANISPSSSSGISKNKNGYLEVKQGASFL